MRKPYVLGVMSLCAMSFFATGSQAGHELYDVTISDCRGLNCSSIAISGSLLTVRNATNRWEAAVYAAPGECLRIDETDMRGDATDDEMVVVGPAGDVWRNDDYNGLLPRVAFVAPNNGWYYVSIAHNGGAALEHNLTVEYGRYEGGASNPNCANPTPMLGGSSTAAAKPRVAPSASSRDTIGAPGTR